MNENLLIDIDAELQAMDEDPSVLIELDNGALLELLIDVPRQMKLKAKYIKPAKFSLDAESLERFTALKAQIGKENPTPEDIENAIKGHESEFAIQADEGNQDFYGFGVALCEFACGWRRFKGSFSKEKVKKWIQRKPGIAERLGRQFDKILTQYGEKHTKLIEAEEKN